MRERPGYDFKGRPIHQQTESAQSSYLHFEDMTWPNPHDPNEVQWRLRYGTPTKSDLLVAASFMESYAYLIGLPQRTRNERVRQLRERSTPPGKAADA